MHKKTNADNRFQAHLLNMADQALIAFTPEGAVLCANPAAAALFRIPADSLTGRSIAEPELAGKSCAQEFRLLLRRGAQKPWQGEMQLHRWDGASFPALVKVSAVGERVNAEYVLVAISDISGSRRVQSKLERSIKRLENLRAIDRILLGARTPEEVAEATLRIVCEMIPCSAASISLIRPDTRETHILAARITSERRPRSLVPGAPSVPARRVRSGATVRARVRCIHRVPKALEAQPFARECLMPESVKHGEYVREYRGPH